MTDNIDKPAHYDLPIQPIDVIEAWGLGFCLGCVVKYIARAGRKTPCPIEDLKKARWYLDREIARLQSWDTIPVIYADDPDAWPLRSDKPDDLPQLDEEGHS